MPLPYLVLLVLLALCRPAQSAEPPTTPQLRLDSGSHQATVNRISTDATGQQLLTVSDDKTARLWDSRDGRLLSSFRIPIDKGDEGKLYAGALSPDGTRVAVAGWTGYDWQGTASIYLFSTDGRLQQRLGGLPNVVLDMAFSADGRQLAAVLGAGNGLRGFDTSRGALRFSDPDYGSNSYSVDSAADGRWLTTCDDGYVRMYTATGTLLAKAKPSGGKEPYAARFSPDGQHIAVGFKDSTALAVLDAANLAPLYSPDTAWLNNGNLVSVAWSADGTRLFAAGTYADADENPLWVWEQAGRGQRLRWPGPQNTVMDIRGLPGGALAYAAGDPAWGVIKANGRPRWQSHGELIDSTGIFKGSFGLSTDGGRLAFGYKQNGLAPARFDVASRRLESLASPDPSLPAPLPVPGLSAWEDEYHPLLHGTALSLQEHEKSFSAAATDGGLVLGTNWYLRRYDRNGKAVWQQPVPDVVWGVAVSGNGRLVLAAYGDGTLRWHRADTGAEVLAFYPHPDRKRWLLWTPGGYYDAAPGADRLLGWHVNRGLDHAADFFPADRFRARFYRPDVIDRVLATLDETVALQQADAARGRITQAAPLATVLPPVVELVSPANGDSFSQSQVTLRYRLRSPSGQPITAVKILLDGRPMPAARGLERQAAELQQVTVELPARDVELAIIAENANAASEAARLHLHWTGQTAAAVEFSIKPKLYVLAIGTSSYKNPALKLSYPAKDAADFIKVMQGQAGGLYREVEVKPVLNGNRDAVLDGLDWLEKQVTDKDVAMVFISGHGENDRNGEYQYLAADADPDNLRRTAVPYLTLLSTLKNLSGKVLAFIDTCYAGNVMGARKGSEVDINQLVNDLSATENGLVVFAASARKQYSLEDPSWGNGAFTKALVEGISGGANYGGNGTITINMLDLYLAERVKQITGGRQTPTTAKPDSIADFPLAVAVKPR